MCSMRVRSVVFLVALTSANLSVPQETVVPVEVARTDTYSEGPVFDKDGNLYVSHDRFISRVAPDGNVQIWAETGAPSGHKILADGTHIVCDFELVRLDAAGKFLETVATDCGGQPIRKTNDLTLDSLGGVYFTDPGVATEGALEDEKGKLCYVDADGATHLVAEKLGFPNGVILTPDGETLLVGEAMPGRNRILQFPVVSPGKVGDSHVFAELPSPPDDRFVSPDGMAFDRDGRLYVAHYGMGQIQVFDLEGRLVQSLPAGNTAVSNLAFGGPEMNQLYITGSRDFFDTSLPGFVYRLDLKNVQGLPVQPSAR